MSKNPPAFAACGSFGEADSFKTEQDVRAFPGGYQIDLIARLRALRRSGEVSRKEVIQPQVLLQLPCYDFTPITDHTLGMRLPCGLAALLLVQPAFVM